MPLIVRSSSLLEDNFGTSFAGKYDSYFCPNQGTLDENLEALLSAIRRTYASSVNPDALFIKDGKYSEALHHNSYLAVGVPGTVAGLALALAGEV